MQKRHWTASADLQLCVLTGLAKAIDEGGPRSLLAGRDARGRKVLEALCRIHPEADIVTHVYVPGAVSTTIRRHKVTTSMISQLPRPERHFKSCLAVMPMALEQLNLRGFDLVVNSESGPAKGVIPPGEATYVFYCHSPMCYVWNMMHDHSERTSPLRRLGTPPFLHYVRKWDVTSATRVDRIVANSKTVAKRVETFWRREAEVVFPPVDPAQVGDYHLMAGELVRYKRPELAVLAFIATVRRLVVVGGGEMLAELCVMAGPTVEILGTQPLDVLRAHYAAAEASSFWARRTSA